MQISLPRRRHMGTESKLTLLKIFSIRTCSMFLLTDLVLSVLRLTRTLDILATSGVPKRLSFSKVWTSCFIYLFPVFDVFPDICGRLAGERIVKTSLSGTICGLCKELPVSTITRASRHSLPLITTHGCSWMGWNSSTGSLPLHGSDDISLRICIGRIAPEIPVRCNDIKSQLPLR